MAALAPDTSRSSSPSTSSGPVVMPPPHDYSMITLPKATISEKHESAPIASPTLNENGVHSQITDFGTKNSPLNQIMQALGHSTAGFLKLLVGIIRLIPGLGKN